MAKHNANYNADRDSVAEIGKGTLYICLLDQNDKPIPGTKKSLGLQTAISVAFERTTANFEHTLFDRNYTMKTKNTGLTVTLDVTFEEFKLGTLSKFLNSDVKSNAAATETIEFTAQIGSVTKSDSFVLDIEGGIDEVTSITMGTSQVLVEGENYVVNSGSIYFMTVDEQNAAGASVVVDTTTTASELEVVVKTTASKTVEFETTEQKNFGLYAEMYNNYDEKTLKQFWFHKATVNIDSLPLKTDGDDLQNYTATFTLLPSKAIKDPSESKFFRMTESTRA